MNKPLTVRELLGRLAGEGLVRPMDEANEALVSAIQVQPVEAELPWYVRLFVGLSAWIAAILFVAFLFMVEILQDEENGVAIGLVFCALAVGLAWWRGRSVFFGQLALAVSLTGQALFAMGLGAALDFDATSVALGLLLLELALLGVYPSQLHRFISTLVGLGAVLMLVFEQDAPWLLHGLIFALAAGFVALQVFDLRLQALGAPWPGGEAAELAHPVLYATATFFIGLLVLPVLEYEDLDWRITALLLTGVLLFLGLWILLDLGLGRNWGAMVWLVAGCGLLFIPAMRMPGILAALIVLLAGFWRGQRVLQGLAAAALVAYLSAYYYNLNWTLLEKSLALMATGAVLFGLRYLLLRQAHETLAAQVEGGEA